MILLGWGRPIGLAVLGATAVTLPALAADREQPRIVVNLIGGIKAPFGRGRRASGRP